MNEQRDCLSVREMAREDGFETLSIHRPPSRTCHRKYFLRLFPIVGFLMSILPSYSCSGGKQRVFRESKLLMGTVVEIAVVGESEERSRDAIREALEEIARVDELLSTFKPGSVVSRLNHNGAIGKITVGKDVFSLIRAAAAISEASGGAFDITIGPIVKLWGFESGGARPSEDILGSTLPLVGYKNLNYDENSYAVGFKTSGMQIDLGAIAAGWAADMAIEKLKARGTIAAIVDAGGELRLIGTKPGGVPWRIGVQDPRSPGELLMTFDLGDTAVATSGDYERFFMDGGVRYHHILDPATGMPARGCRSVTVLAPTAAEADACSTAAFVLGPERGIAFLRSRPGVRGFIVDEDGALHWTDEALERMARR